MGRNPEIIKTVILHTQQEKHVAFKEEILAALKTVILCLWGEKRDLKIKSNSHQGLTKVLVGRKEKYTNSFFFPGEILGGVGEVKTWKFSQIPEFCKELFLSKLIA